MRKLYRAGSSGPREAEQTHPVGTHRKNTHKHLIQTPGTVLRGAQDDCPFLCVLTLCFHMARGSLLLWGCGDQLMVSWWILDNPRRTQCKVLFVFPSMYHYFSVFLCTQKSFCDGTYRWWCSHKLILCLAFDQLQEVTHWGCVERQKMLEEFAFGIIFDKASVPIPLSMSFP